MLTALQRAARVPHQEGNADVEAGVCKELLHESQPEAHHLHGLEWEESAERGEELGLPAQVWSPLAGVPQPRVVREQPVVLGPVVQVLLQAGVVAVEQVAEGVDGAAGQRLAAHLHDVVVQQRLVVVEVGRVGVQHVAEEGGAGAPGGQDDGAHGLAAQLGHQVAERARAHVVRAARVPVAGHLLGDHEPLLLDDALHVQGAVGASRAAPRLQLRARPALYGAADGEEGRPVKRVGGDEAVRDGEQEQAQRARQQQAERADALQGVRQHQPPRPGAAPAAIVPRRRVSLRPAEERDGVARHRSAHILLLRVLEQVILDSRRRVLDNSAGGSVPRRRRLRSRRRRATAAVTLLLLLLPL